MYDNFIIRYNTNTNNMDFHLQDNIPVISVMCNRGMRGRHWKQMSDIAGFDLTPDSGTTLRKMLKLNLEPYMEQFEGISAAATKVCYCGFQCRMNFEL